MLQSLKFFLDLANKRKSLNMAIFSLLDHYLPSAAKSHESYIPPPKFFLTESAI
jgi:hypothetical protein